MDTTRVPAAKLLVVLAIFTLVPGAFLHADGTERLGVPSLSIVNGSGIVARGVGLTDNEDPATDPSGTIDIDVPGTVRQALLYWTKKYNNGVFVPQPDLLVGSTSVTGELIGGPVPVSGSQVAC